MNYTGENLEIRDLVKLLKIAVEQLRNNDEDIIRLKQENERLRYLMECRSDFGKMIGYPLLSNGGFPEEPNPCMNGFEPNIHNYSEETKEVSCTSSGTPSTLDGIDDMDEPASRYFEIDSAHSGSDTTSWASKMKGDDFVAVRNKGKSKKSTVHRAERRFTRKLNSFVKYDGLKREMEGMADNEKRIYIREEYQKVLDLNGYADYSNVLHVGLNTRCKEAYYYVIFEIDFDPEDELLHIIRDESDRTRRIGTKFGRYLQMYGLMGDESLYIRFTEHIAP